VSFRLNTRDAPIDRPGSVFAFGDPGLLGSTGDPVQFGRFLLVSVGFHLLVALAVGTIGLHPAPLPEHPLVVRLVEAEAPKPSPSVPQRGRTRPAKQTTVPRATEPPGPKLTSEPKVGLVPVSHPEPGPAREMINEGAPDERRVLTSQRPMEDLVKDLDLPRQTPSVGAQNAGGGGIGGPKGVGVPMQVTMAAGAVAGRGLQADPAVAGDESERLGVGGSRGQMIKGVTGTIIPLLPSSSGGGVGKAGRGAGPKAVEGGATAAVRTSGLSSTPALVGGESEGARLVGSRGNAQRGLPKSLLSSPPSASAPSLGKAGKGGGPWASQRGAPVVVSPRGLSSGPALLGDGGEGTRPASGGPGGERKRGVVLTAPLAPTVTVRSRQGVGGSGARGGSSAADGQFAAPNYGTNPLPSYPLLARERGYQGTVYLLVQIQPDGRVGRLAIDRSSGFEILDRAATDSVKEWTFLPARRSGKPVDSWVVLPVKFKLD
jgi:protein TonB